MTVIYAKYTDYRKARFRIMTAIERDRKTTRVIKKNAPGGCADLHLQSIAANVPLLEEFYRDELSVCPCRYEDGRLIFSYIEGVSLLEKMKRAIHEDGVDAFLVLLRDYAKILTGPETNLVPFAYTQEFTQVFGQIEGLAGIPSLRVSNLDASPANIIETPQGVRTLIDYEWICNFCVPRDFVLFRHLRFLYAESGFSWDTSMTLGSLLQACDVHMDLDLLMQLYDAFQRYVCVEDGAVLSCSEVFERHRKPMYDAGEGRFRRPQHFVFLDTGAGFNEQEKLIFPSVDGNIDITVDVENVQNLRFDPFEGQRTLTSGLGFKTEADTYIPYGAPDVTRSGERVIFNTPANIQIQIPEDVRRISITGFMLFMGERDEYWLGEANAAEQSRDAALQSMETQKAQAQERERALEDGQRQQKAAYEEQMAAKDLELEQLHRRHAEELEKVSQQNAAEVETLRSELREAMGQVGSLEQTVQAIQESTSWRVTGWLRKLGSLRRKN